jgi:hypothetical protein
MSRLRRYLEARAWARFRRQHGAGIPRPLGRLRKALRTAWGLLAGFLFAAAWLLVLPALVVGAPVLWAWRRLLGGEED